MANIPVYLGDRLLCTLPANARKCDVYDKLWMIWNISKVHAVYYPKKKFIIETYRKKDWVPA